LGDLDRAVADYSRAVTLDPKLTAAWRDRAVVYRYLEKCALAVADADRVIKSNPEDVEMYALRAACYAALGKPKLSLADLSRIIRLRPRFPATYAVRAWVWRALGRPRLAAMDLAVFRRLAGRKRTAAVVVAYAKSFIGLPYLFGGASARKGFDCSGLMKHVYGLFGVKLPRHSKRQFEAGRPVARDKLQPGDLVFFQSARTGWHVGLYIGANQFLHATARGGQVRVDSLAADFYHRHFKGGRRVLD
ncbi:MAG: C40 family peptidase, partial [Proteobacteria bacterium]|nr:C40 family peptidase [Pseudomonadota bacterium]MBU1742795.1 C40 family peptidase [Pseudomonadota bacterium]